MQRRMLGVRAGVARDEMQLRHRHVKAGVVRVLQGEELVLDVIDLQRPQALVAAHAVVDMYHRRPDGELRQVPHHQFRVDAALPAALRCLRVAAAEDLRFRDDREVRQPRAAVDVRHHQREGRSQFPEGREARHRSRPQPGAAQELLEMLTATRCFRGEQHRRIDLGEKRLQTPRLVMAAMARGELRQRPPTETHAMPVLGAFRV